MNECSDLRAPYPWHGGKRRVSGIVWRAFGPDVPGYIEPFWGSGAVLLGRPGGAGKIETINDIDGGVVNFWRAIQAAPDEVARWCDWPISELDLHARHTWLIQRLEILTEELRADPNAYDVQVAGWWVWGICQWIGTGWCGGIKRGRPRPNLNSGQGVHANLTTEGWKQIPYLRTDGLGIHLPALGNDRGINGVAAPPAMEWFRALSSRLRRVRMVCGDWKRIVTPAVLGKGRNVGGRSPVAVFLDAPYLTELRKDHIYNHDEVGLSEQVREWAIEHGDDPELRIALCGYFDEHAARMPTTWTVYRWKGARGYAAVDNDNREQETIWFSPHCLPLDKQRSLFE